jgi:hypothetical protein
MRTIRDLLIASAVVVGIASAALLSTGTPPHMLLAGLREMADCAAQAVTEFLPQVAS